MSAFATVRSVIIVDVTESVSPVVTKLPVTPLGIVITPSIVGFIALN